MRSRRLQRWLTVVAMLALPMMVHAQEATLSGTVTDTTGGALPGVTVRAVHEASGNSFEAVTDARGEYRIPVRVGAYRLTTELAGFAPVARSVTVLVGQQAVVNLQLAVSGVQESVTVTGEAPLLDVTQSSLGGNIDPRQLQALPVNGRNWLDLVMLAPGSRVNSVGNSNSEPSDAGTTSSRGGEDYELNVDGQQVNQLFKPGLSNPRFSRDAIGEFEFLSGRFDATQGRSTGMQVNAVTKSGTNTPSGSFSGYFRDDRFIAADAVAKRVLPYQDQQLSWTFGGPIRKDKLHVFTSAEYERRPKTALYTTPYPYLNRDLSGVETQKLGMFRLDAQFSPRTRLGVRGSAWLFDTPPAGASGTAPSWATNGVRRTSQLLATLTQVLSNRLVNEVKVGYAALLGDDVQLLTNPRARFGYGGTVVSLQGLRAGGNLLYPSRQGSDASSVREDFTYSFTKGGRHTLKLGAEYLYFRMYDYRGTRTDGELQADSGPLPAGVTIENVFPDQFDPSTWNLALLNPIAVRWRQQFGPIGSNIPRHTSAEWVQDDWTVTQRLTLNLGLRYDLELNAFANDIVMLPFLTGSNQHDDKNNVGPRTGFTFSLNDRTVLRGGYGLYFGTAGNNHFGKNYEHTINLAVEKDGRPDFASNPFNGPAPTYESLVAKLCTPALVPGCIRREVLVAGVVYGPNFTMPYAHQGSIGLQRQLGTTMAIEADYVYAGSRGYAHDLPVNVTYNPATGANYPFSDISHRAFPDWGYVSFTVNGYRGNSHALQTAFTKRFSNGWQASGTYTLSVFRDAQSRPIQWNGSRFEVVSFPTAPDMGGEYGLAAGDQRHRAVFNGVWQLRYGFQLSGLYFFGSGLRYPTLYGSDLRQFGAVRPNELRLRPDGTIVPRNTFVGKPIHRVDLRLQRRIPLGGRAGIDGILEVFNVFNHANYGSYAGLVGPGSSSVGGEISRNYGQPAQNDNVAYAPRMLQLGFRFSF